MATTQSKDPKEEVNHPRHYNQHPSGIETIEIIEWLPSNLAAAIKYIWRCGLKQTSTPLRDLRSAEWYVRREMWVQERFHVGWKTLMMGEDAMWRPLAEKIIEDARTRETYDLLAFCLGDLLRDDLEGLAKRLEKATLGHW